MDAAIKQSAPKTLGPAAAPFTYGTAGFRMKAELLPPVVYCVGILAALRSKKLGGKTIGVMITASHNAEPDNGVKVVDPLGEMLEGSWEAYATELANCKTAEALAAAAKAIAAKAGIDLGAPSRVAVARDTRPSGPELLEQLKRGTAAGGANETVDLGVTTTPLLHFYVRSWNTKGTPAAYGEPSAAGYYGKLSAAYARLVEGFPALSELQVDAANGVGALAAPQFVAAAPSGVLRLALLNADLETRGKLNHGCGADHVKLYQRAPDGFELEPEKRYCSLDGDADRVVYYYCDAKTRAFRLLDGDKIAGLAAAFFAELVRAAGIEGLALGVVQTAYANGASTRYLAETLRVPVSCVCTGVKHLHHEAESKYDIGIYFEANGHGTIVFSARAEAAFRKAAEAGAPGGSTLVSVVDVINQSVGDALSDVLLVEAILTRQQKSLAAWDADYTDLPSRQEKVPVANRAAFKAVKADTVLVEPAGLQARIDALVCKFPSGRCFVRPSGTEDIVRVYAESDTPAHADELAYSVAALVFDYHGGVGARPGKYPSSN